MEPDSAHNIAGFSTAFIILAHSDPIQLERLVQSLPSESPKLLHLDRKSRSLAGFSTSAKNTELVAPNLETYWGAFSLVEASLRALKVGLSSTSAQRFVLLSGQCYPLRSNFEIMSFFQKHRNAEFIKYYDIRSTTGHYVEKLTKYHFSEDAFSALFGSRPSLAKIASRVSSRAARPFKRDWRKALGRFVPAYGSQWWALTRPCAEMIVRSADEPELQFFRHTFAPDEMFFHTIVANSRFHESAGGFRPFTGRGNRRIANLHMLNSGSLHKIFTIDDWDEVAKSDRLFIRKVNSIESGALIDRIEMELRRNA
jgi:hypothetical protein